MITFKQFLESSDPLKDVQIEMFFRKELDVPQAEAEVARDWLQGNTYWGDLDPDLWDKILAYVGLEMDEDDRHYAPAEVQLDAHESIISTLRRKYKIKL